MPTKLFVGNLPEDCTKESLQDLFGSYGGIDEVAIIKNFAFIHFTSEDDAKKAMKDLHGTKFAGKALNVELSNRGEKRDNRGRDNRDNRDNRDSRDNRDRGRDRDRDRDRSERGPRSSRDGPGVLGAGPGLGPLVSPGLGALGGAPGLASLLPGGLGALGGLGANPLGGLGILSELNTLAAVAGKNQQLQQQQHQPSSVQQQQLPPNRTNGREQPDPDVRVRREVVHTQDIPNSASMGLGNGYVIYERYYVDASHPLLKGLPLPQLPRMSDSRQATGNVNNAAPPSASINLNPGGGGGSAAYRDRSPMNGNREFDLRDYNHQRQ